MAAPRLAPRNCVAFLLAMGCPLILRLAGGLGFDHNIARQPHLIIAERRGPEPDETPNGPSPPGVKGMAPPAGSWLRWDITADKPSTAREAQSFSRRD